MNFWQFANLHPVAATLMVLFVAGALEPLFRNLVGRLRKDDE